MFLSIIIPLYNEASRGVGTPQSLQHRLEKLKDELNLKKEFEVILVDDNSKDDTHFVCATFVRKHNLQNWSVHKLPKNGGKGKAIQAGLKAAKGNYVMFIDADLSIAPDYINEFFAKNMLVKDVCYVGNRYMKGSLLQEKRNPVRKVISFVSHAVIRLFSGVPVGDTQCGFKVFHRSTYLRFARFLAGYRWLFDIELLYGLHCIGVKLVSVPVVWNNMESESTLNIVSALRRSLMDFLHFLCRKKSIKSQIKLTKLK